MATTTIRLTIVAGPEAGRQIEIPPAGMTLGRSRVADLHFDDGLLSRLHCRIFYAPEPSVQDLGSSNGTLLNGIALGSEPKALKEGDVVSMGETVLRVSLVGGESLKPVESSPIADVVPSQESTAEPSPTPPPSQGPVDLGLGVKAEDGGRRRSSLTGLILALVALLVLALGAGLFFSYGQKSAQTGPTVKPLTDASVLPFEVHYERLAVDAHQLFRYALVYGDDGMLRLTIDDLGDADRSFSKTKKLSPQAIEALRRELLDSNYTNIGEMFPERSADGVTLRQKRLTIVFGAEIWARTSENVSNKAFDALCERLETFGRNELGAYATQYSVSELRDMGQEQLTLARRYWEQRDLGDEKLWLCISAYRRGISALETLNPKPSFAEELTSGLKQADTLLSERYDAEAFAVDQAMNVQRYEQAAEHLRRILRMIPDREDERNISATEKLLSVENRFLKRRK